MHSSDPLPELTGDTVPLDMSHYSKHLMYSILVNSADVYVIYSVKSFTSVPHPESESELGSTLLVLKLNNGCFKMHSERFHAKPSKSTAAGASIAPDPTGGANSAPQTL